MSLKPTEGVISPLYEEATKAKVPVSLATVYNTLHQFTDVGLLRQVAVDGSKTYFDTNVSISAVTWRSPLLNRIQPTAIRWRVGRRPTSRSMDFTSRHGHR